MVPAKFTQKRNLSAEALQSQEAESLGISDLQKSVVTVVKDVNQKKEDVC